jgi:hypothetical protein
MKYLKKFGESFDTMGGLIILVISTKKLFTKKKTKLIIFYQLK